MAAPRHVAIIPDGNRRWARARGLPPSDGHRAGMQRMAPAVGTAFDSGVEVVSFWWGSPSNLLNRTPDEVRVIVEVLGTWFTDHAPALLQRYNARLDVVGRWDQLCPELVDPVAHAMESAGDGPRRVVVLMGYDGREEILAAADALGGSGGSGAAFAAALWTGDCPAVDVVIRTGDSAHLSAGFLLWHIAEAQLVFLPQMWPDLTVDQLDDVLAQQATVPRRYGR